MTRRTSTFAPLLAAVAIVLIPLGVYLGGYFWLGEYTEINWGVLDSPPTDHFTAWRTFPNARLMNLYAPLGKVESWVRGYDVDLSSDEPDVTPSMPIFSDEEMMPEEAPEDEPRPEPRVRIIIHEATGQIVL